LISLRCVGDEVPRQEIAASCTTQGMGNPMTKISRYYPFKYTENKFTFSDLLYASLYLYTSTVYSEIWISQNEKLGLQ
jgi:hypothetical protein